MMPLDRQKHIEDGKDNKKSNKMSLQKITINKQIDSKKKTKKGKNFHHQQEQQTK